MPRRKRRASTPPQEVVPEPIPTTDAQLAAELRAARDLLASSKAALERLRPFLLSLHRRSVYLPADLQDQLTDIVQAVLNLGGTRPTGRAAQRSPAEREVIVREYEVARASGVFGACAAVARKYNTTSTQIVAWRDRGMTAAGRPPAYLTAPDPLAEAIAKMTERAG